ncbi:MAG: hypothetical protein GY844_30335, partial [Bradyrhizobium sp.]|nr:hypothetical protein [Bradyrhizobium sp.]
ARALAGDVKAILLNPLMRGVRIDRSVRGLELAALLAERRMPLLAVYRDLREGENLIDWYELADFCNAQPDLPVIAWEWRVRANRPMFDALATTRNLRVSVSSLWQAQMVERICDSFGADRLVFSLGLPSLDPASFQAVVAYADIDAAAKEAIAAGTVRAIIEEADYE